jgi:hypothetical protein
MQQINSGEMLKKKDEMGFLTDKMEIERLSGLFRRNFIKSF